MYQWFDEENNVIVVYLALPDGINEVLTPNGDGTYTIFISTQICEEKQRNAYAHALCHIRNNDFEKNDVNAIENDAHKRKK